MDAKSSEEEELGLERLHSSVNYFQKKKPLSFKENKKGYLKRSSSMSLNMPKIFAPKIQPIKPNICPSPINLNKKSSPSPEIINNNKISSLSLNQKKEINLQPIKYIYSRTKNLRKSNKFMIEEETHETEAISDCEDKSKKISLAFSDSDSSKSDIEDSDKGKNDITKNINFYREKMIIIRKNSICNENIYDDSEIGNSYVKKRFYQDRIIYQQKFIDKIRSNNNMSLNPLKSINNRTRTFKINQRYVPTILGFLEKNNSTNSLNSNGK